MTSPPRPRKPRPTRSRHTTVALFGHDVATLVGDALAAGLRAHELAERLRAAAERLEADGPGGGAK